ncbi:MAG: cation:proton antiporter subunit C [Verrucomicrobiota bacterium]
METIVEQTLEPHFNYWIYVILMMIGLWAVIAKNNLIKKLIGLSIFQTAIILFYVSLGVKEGSTIPILDHHSHSSEASDYEKDHHDRGDSKDHDSKETPKEGDTSSTGDRKEDAHSDHSSDKAHQVDPDTMANPLPHVLMLTAIVVGVATIGVALALTQMIYLKFGTIEEDEVLKVIKEGGSDD